MRQAIAAAIHVGLNLSRIAEAAGRRQPGGTGIRGKVLADGKPLDRARVTLYQDGETIFRGVGDASVLTGAEGDSSFNLEPGSYYVVARKRAGDDRMGPLGGGDYFGYAHENPVAVEKDAYTVVAVHSVTKLVKVKEGGQEVTLDGTVKAGGTVVSGVVRDAAGKPVKGLFVVPTATRNGPQSQIFITGSSTISARPVATARYP